MYVLDKLDCHDRLAANLIGGPDVRHRRTETCPVSSWLLAAGRQGQILIGSGRNYRDICNRSRVGPDVPSDRAGSCRFVH